MPSVVTMRMPKNTATAFSERKPARIRSKRRVATSASETGHLGADLVQHGDDRPRLLGAVGGNQAPLGICR